MTAKSPGVETILAEAVEIPDPATRGAFLDRACGADAALRSRLGRMADDHFRAGSFLEHPAAVIPAETAAFESGDGESAVGSRVGPYALRELLGEGGMGAVYVAEQSEPVRRKVALKVIKPGMDSKQVVARFEAERQALALMDHPNIARILDGGTTEEGRPFFVMELVRGIPITDYCDRAALTTRQRLEFFVQVCQAVQHAHQKGVIHRDLKPGNILVTLYDGKPVPKVIDFGVAKAVGARLTDQTVYTRLVQMVGTPLYMSPEQAELSAVDVDTRSDVYALGVLLYELLTGTTPFDAERIRTAGFDEIRRIIREDEPPRPSQRLSTLAAETRSTVSSAREVDGRRLAGLLRGELDWVVMKCLEKDRDRRYESASALAADVQRYLTDEQVEACPPSAGYRLRKFWRRNRRFVGMAGVVVLALVAGTTVSIWQAVRATDAQRQAEADRDRARAVELEAAAISEFLQHDLLRQVHRDAQIQGGFAPVAELTVREALDRAAGRIGDRFHDRPLLEAAIRRTIGESYNHIGEAGAAAAQLERAVALYRDHLGRDHRDTLAALYALAMPYQFTGRLPDAMALLEQVHDRYRAVLGPDHWETLQVLNSLGEACRKAGQLDRAQQLITRARERKLVILGPDHETTINSTHDLGLVYRDMGRYPEAAALLKDATWRLEAKWGADHSDARYSRQNLIGVYEQVGQLDEANRYLRAGIRADETPDPRPTDYATPLRVHLYRNLLASGKHADAEPLLRECLAIWERHAADGWARFCIMHELGESLVGQKRYAEAEPLLLNGYAGMKEREAQIQPEGRKRVAEAIERLARLYEASGRPDDARAWREKATALKPPGK